MQPDSSTAHRPTFHLVSGWNPTDRLDLWVRERTHTFPPGETWPLLPGSFIFPVFIISGVVNGKEAKGPVCFVGTPCCSLPSRAPVLFPGVPAAASHWLLPTVPCPPGVVLPSRIWKATSGEAPMSTANPSLWCGGLLPWKSHFLQCLEDAGASASLPLVT